MTRRAFVAIAAWTAYLVLANVAWLREQLPLRPPNWDRALYLYLSVRFQHALHDGGLAALFDEFVHRSPTVAPFFPLSTLAGYWAAGETRLAAHATTSLYLVILLAATFLLGRRLHGTAAALLAAFALSCFPGVTLAARDYLMDFPAAALATAAVALLLESDFGRQRGRALAFGALVGLTLITKTMAGVFLLGPLAEALWRSRRHARDLANLGSALVLGALVAASWWAPNHAEALGYLWRYGFTSDAEPFAAGGSSLLSMRNLLYYPSALVNEGLGPIATALLALVLLASLRAARQDGFALRWFAVSLAILTAVPNKSGDRYILGMLPALALVTAGGVARIRARRLRAAAIAALVLASGHAHMSLTYDLGLPRLYYHFRTGLLAVRPARPAGAGDGVENPWPVAHVVEALHAEGTHARQQPLPPLPAAETPEEFVREAYRHVLRREPDAAGLAAYTRDLAAGALTPEGLLRAIAASPEFTRGPFRVLVVPDHPFVNASVLRYYAERARLPLVFEHPTGIILVPLDYDVAVLKHGGEQGPAHTTATIPMLEDRLRTEGERWRARLGRFRCPDGSEIEVLGAKPAW